MNTNKNKNKISFTKMQGLGNDFVIIDAVNQQINLSNLSNIPISILGDRHFGIGFDQLILIESIDSSSLSTSADFFCRIFNSDGSEAEQCGNGLRCVAKFIRDNKLHADSILKLATKAGIFSVTIHDDEKVSILMGVPNIQETKLFLSIENNSSLGPLCIISLGNPHAILSIDSTLTDKEIIKLGKQISTHSYFKTGINAGLMQINNSHHIKLRTIERGAGETFACGSNACAAAAAGILLHGLDHCVEVEFQYGLLTIEWPNEREPIKMTGPAVTVFSGEFFI
jgi:diaminopimelate epimerase